MLHHFQILPFIGGLAIGALLLFYYKAPPTTIYEYPHPHNVSGRVYRDKNNICYSYNSVQVDCDANVSTLKQYPLQG